MKVFYLLYLNWKVLNLAFINKQLCMYFVRVHYTFLNVTHYKLTHSHAVKKLKWFTPSVEQGSWENDFPVKGSFTNYVYKMRWVGTLRCQINESTRLAFFDFFPRPTSLFGPTRSHFPPYSISKFSTILIYLVHWSSSFMKIT
jgi:hypothetical protein